MKKFAILFLIALLLVPALTFAADPANPCATEDGAVPSLGECVSRIYIWSLAAAALLALLMAVVGGYLVMTASGNAQQATKGKEYVSSALVGLALLLAAYLILSTINPDLVDFTVSGIDTGAPPPQQ